MAESSARSGFEHSDAEQSPQVEKAAQDVRLAEAELRRAREIYENLREQTIGRLRDVREKRLGDLIDGTLNTVRKHPGPGVIVATLVGFFLGRLFRR